MTTTTLHIFPAGSPTCESYEIVKETPKAYQLRCTTTRKENFPVWVPKAAIIAQRVQLPGVDQTLLHFAKWFTPEKPWQRVSLGFSTY